MPRRNKIAVFLMMPLAISIWLIGWVITYFGSKQEISRKKVFVQGELTFAVLPLQQEVLSEIRSS
jgi:hypothetical protein